MIDTIYLEKGAEHFPKTKEILSRFSKANIISCGHYKEVFNPSNQSFRLQKKNPALILAQQRGKLTHPIPQSYGVGGKHNFYFSHLLNCLYDCRYCFLQGMYPSAHYLLFVNFDDFKQEIVKTVHALHEESWFFSGYDCDSLALESVTGFASDFLPFFRELPNVWIELRTKSVAIQSLQKVPPLERAVVAFSLTPEEISTQLEHGVPTVGSRIKAMTQLAKLGWKIGLRIDPLVDCEDFEKRYQRLFKQIFKDLSHDSVHSVSVGAFRMPTGFFKKIEKQYPEEPLFAGNLSKNKLMVGYGEEIENELVEKCAKIINHWIDQSKIFYCE